MTVIDTMERKVAANDGVAAWMEPFLRKLGDPSRWVYTGECDDSGSNSGAHCICGESIRYLYHITLPGSGRDEIVGSVCIDHFQTINPGLYADLVAAQEGLMKRLADAKRAAKLAEQQAEVGILKAEFDKRMESLDKWCVYYREKNARQWKKLPEWLYWGLVKIGRCPTYQGQHSYIKWYSKQIEYLDTIMLPNVPGGVW